MSFVHITPGDSHCFASIVRFRLQQTGFTLIELLVVLVVLALFSGMVVLSIGDSFQRKLLAEAERFQSIMIAASDEAIYTYHEFGVYLTDNEYLILRWDQLSQGWVPLAAQPFTLHTLPEGMKIEWTVDGFTAPADDDDDAEVLDIGLSENELETDRANNNDDGAFGDERTVDLQPQILALSSAEMSVFNVVFSADESVGNQAAYEIVSDGFSQPWVRQFDTTGEVQ